MKKLFSTMLAAVTALAALATNYTGTLTVDGMLSQATVTVNNSGSDYTVIINNVESIGNIEITAPGTTSNGLTSVIASQDIDAGKANMVLAFNQYAMTFNLDIVTSQGNTINVKFAQDGEQTGYQIKNSGFENFKSNGEPFAWHGFKSATGTWASLAPATLGSSEDCHSGTYSALMEAGSAFGKVGNGTMTTGRLNAGSTSPNSTSNCSKMDISDTNLDTNNDPYYTIMNGRPDAIKFWVKFEPKTSSEKASMSAIITDGTAYQDPENTTYTNKLATAKNTTSIGSCGWTEFSVPFNYIDTSITGRALLVTFSTNATPGGGAKGDKLYVDDIALVYNAAITGISIKGAALEGFSQDTYEYNFDLAEGETFADSDIAATYVSEHAYLIKKAIETSDGYKLFVAVVSNDLNTVKVYTINYIKPATPLATILSEGIDENEYTVADELAIADGFEIIDDDSKIVGATDGNGNYIALIVPTDFSATSIAAKGLTGFYTIENGNPAISANGNIIADTDAVTYDIETVNLSLIEQNGFNVAPSQVIYLQGYGDADGKLRSYRSYPQGTSIIVNNMSGVPIQAGNRYKMFGMMTLNEAWDTQPQGIMPKIAPTDPRWFDNYTFVATSGEETVVTAIENINNDSRVIEGIYNTQGQRVSENATGILIIRYTDGTASKVIKR
ncbi:MAG: hypothetical protein IKT03_07105 [Muribaculaceae bacterium]|nr:hypothetical protein [Muribaculaceae bacterium]